MQEAFGILIFVVVAVAAVVALATIAGTGRLSGQIGKGGFSMDGEEAARSRSPAGGAVAVAERDEEVRQMLTARNARRVARGQEPVDVEDELARLVAPAATPIDAGLEAEIRSLVVARNERRVRQGKEPLDVEAEVVRQARELGGPQA